MNGRPQAATMPLREAAELLGIGISTAYAHARETDLLGGCIPVIRFGQPGKRAVIKVRRADVNDLLNNTPNHSKGENVNTATEEI